MPGGVGRVVDKLFQDSTVVARGVEDAQQARLAGQVDITLWNEHPGLDQSTVKMLTGRATKYLSQQTTGAKPRSGLALFTKEQFEGKFGKMEGADPEQVRKYYWQLKTGDGIEDLVVLKAPRGLVQDVEGKAVAAAMWKMNPKAKIPVLIETPGQDWSVAPVRSVSWRGSLVPLELPKYAPPPPPRGRPSYEFDEAGRVGKVYADPTDPRNGDISFADRGSDRTQVMLSFVPEKMRGTGQGIAMYDELAKQTHARGRTLVSDTRVSKDAAKMYDSLEKRGYAVTRNEFETEEGTGDLLSTSGRPVFEVKPKEESTKPLTTVRQAE